MYFSTIALVAIMLVSLASESVEAQTRRQQRELNRLEGNAAYEERRAQLEARQARTAQHERRVAELRQEGWRVNGPRTLEVALLDHYEKDPEGNKTRTQEVANCRTINLCTRSAMTQAQNSVAQLANAHVRGRVGEVLANHGAPQTDVDKVMAQYGTLVDAEVGGFLTESYTLIRERNGAYEAQVAFIVDKEKALSNSMDAMKKSLLETRIIGLELDEIFNSVGHDFDLE